MRNKKGIYAPISVILSTKSMSCFLSFWGLRPQTPPGLCPWTPPGDFRPPDPVNFAPTSDPPSSFRLIPTLVEVLVLFFTYQQRIRRKQRMITVFSAQQRICYSVCPSVTWVDQSKTVEVRIMQPLPQSSPV